MKRTGTDPAMQPRLGLARGSAEASQAEPELIAMARAGDVQAWSRLYEDGFESVYRHACYLTGDPHLAEDMAQDAFARAFTSMDSFAGQSAFVAWVRGIVLNLVRMHWRRAEVSERVHNSLAGMQAVVPSQVQAPDQTHEQNRRLALLYEVLSTLPETLREAFILRDLEGLSTAAAAEQLGITANNLAVRAARARAKIREELARQGWLAGGQS